MQCLNLRVQSPIQKMQTPDACAMFIHIFQTIQCHIPGDCNLDASSELNLLVAVTRFSCVVMLVHAVQGLTGHVINTE